MGHDVIIIGGSFAGLAAAIYLARARRTVCVIDAGQPRNRFADASHGFFTRDGATPGDMLDIMRRQVAAYPGVSLVSATASGAQRKADGFDVELSDGSAIEGAKLLMAFGISDILPDIPGLAERWGKSVLHCPYCHGYEIGGGRIGVMYVTPASLQQAELVADWGPTTLFLNGAVVDAADLNALQSRGIEVEPSPIVELIGSGTALSGVRLADGRVHQLDAVFLSPKNRLNSTIADELGCSVVPSPLGRVIVTDDARQTTVERVFAAGDIARTAQNITFACADGVTAAMAIHRSLLSNR